MNTNMIILYSEVWLLDFVLILGCHFLLLFNKKRKVWLKKMDCELCNFFEKIQVFNQEKLSQNISSISFCFISLLFKYHHHRLKENWFQTNFSFRLFVCVISFFFCQLMRFFFLLFTFGANSDDGQN
mgnify:CR=1 FL=1